LTVAGGRAVEILREHSAKAAVCFTPLFVTTHPPFASRDRKSPCSSTPRQIQGGQAMKDEKPKKRQIRNSTAEFLIFANQAKGDGIEVRFERETNRTQSETPSG